VSSACDAVFKLGTTGSETVLYSFTGKKGNGKSPFGSVVLDVQGNLYGATHPCGPVPILNDWQ
jgi:hypothetical protein